MKQRLLVTLLSGLLFSCSKEHSVDSLGNAAATGSNDDYMPTSAGSEWTLTSATLGTYTLKSLGTDTVINSDKYYKFDNSISGRGYISKNNGTYKNYAHSPSTGLLVDIISLKDAPVGTAWKNLAGGTPSDPVVYNYSIASRDKDKTVAGKTYKNVIEVYYEMIMNNPLTGQPEKLGYGHDYYAKGVGAIASGFTIDLFGFKTTDSTYLVSYTIK